MRASRRFAVTCARTRRPSAERTRSLDTTVYAIRMSCFQASIGGAVATVVTVVKPGSTTASRRRVGEGRQIRDLQHDHSHDNAGSLSKQDTAKRKGDAGSREQASGAWQRKSFLYDSAKLLPRSQSKVLSRSNCIVRHFRRPSWRWMGRVCSIHGSYQPASVSTLQPKSLNNVDHAGSTSSYRCN